MENAPSLRDTLSAAYDEVAETAPVETPVVDTTPAPAVVSDALINPPADTRARDEQGRFAEKPKDQAATPQPAPAVAATPAVEAPKRPSSWKPELEAHWGKLPREVQEEVLRREGDAIKGISTYKTQYESAKPIMDALAPHREMMAAANMKPEQFISNLAGAHQTLSNGQPEDKLRAFAKLAQDYGVPLHELFIQAEDGKVYLNQQFSQQAKPAQPQGLTAEQLEQRLAQRDAHAQLRQMVNQFRETKDAAGNPAFPHFDEVAATMDGILRAGLAKDLPAAYKAALALPQHAGLQQPPVADDKARKAEIAARARAQVVSPRNQTPTELVTDTREQRGLRATISEAFDTHMGGGRV